ncbi:MAG: hypothetical protein K0U68_11765 [Gammaproteobacteria bacterium]|nr:hypothetical protein [Gammaproteobacteria bacterium]
MGTATNARILSGTVKELAEFANEHGYLLKSDRRGYITFYPKYNQLHRDNNIVLFKSKQ